MKTHKGDVVIRRLDATIKNNYYPLALIAQTFCPDTEGPIWAK